MPTFGELPQVQEAEKREPRLEDLTDGTKVEICSVDKVVKDSRGDSWTTVYCTEKTRGTMISQATAIRTRLLAMKEAQDGGAVFGRDNPVVGWIAHFQSHNKSCGKIADTPPA